MKSVSLLEFKHYRYFKVSAFLMMVAIVAYSLDKPEPEPFGGTVLGYILGIAAALIVVFLLLYGVRKRLTPRIHASNKKNGLESSSQRATSTRATSHQNEGRYGGFTLQGWLSSHVYLGGTLIVLATLHTGFQFGLNVHTLSYLLMMLVIFSGFYGTYVYLYLPRLVTENMGGDTLESILLKIKDFDRFAEKRALQFSDEIIELVALSRQKTRIGGNFFQQLGGRQKNCPTSLAVQKLQGLGKGYSDDKLKSFHDLYAIMAHKETAVARARKDVKYKARLDFWLYFHAPLSIAFLVALVAHITAILFYW
ncbi:MAG: hypothetical protein PHU06_06575 [Gallionella sp.]|nr:hypothetical protein [Gallionella sp.]MDD4958177.1 hypothetical protein [Gallionella sp.]